MKKIMNNKPHTNSSAIIASSIDVPNLENDFTNLMNKIEGLPLREIEVELDTIELIEKFGSKNNIKTTAMVNYPLGGIKRNISLNQYDGPVRKNLTLFAPVCPCFG